MHYKVRDGIVMESLCGISLIIATLEARDHCPYVMQLNEASAYIWRLLFDRRSMEEMAALASKDFGITEAEAVEIIKSFLEELTEQNYLIVEKETEEKQDEA